MLELEVLHCKQLNRGSSSWSGSFHLWSLACKSITEENSATAPNSREALICGACCASSASLAFHWKQFVMDNLEAAVSSSIPVLPSSSLSENKLALEASDHPVTSSQTVLGLPANSNSWRCSNTFLAHSEKKKNTLLPLGETCFLIFHEQGTCSPPKGLWTVHRFPEACSLFLHAPSSCA